MSVMSVVVVGWREPGGQPGAEGRGGVIGPRPRAPPTGEQVTGLAAEEATYGLAAVWPPESEVAATESTL